MNIIKKIDLNLLGIKAKKTNYMLLKRQLSSIVIPNTTIFILNSLEYLSDYVTSANSGQYRMFIFYCFLIVMLEYPAPYSLNFSSPMTDSFKGRSSNIAPSPQPHPQTK